MEAWEVSCLKRASPPPVPATFRTLSLDNTTLKPHLPFLNPTLAGKNSMPPKPLHLVRDENQKLPGPLVRALFEELASVAILLGARDLLP